MLDINPTTVHVIQNWNASARGLFTCAKSNSKRVSGVKLENKEYHVIKLLGIVAGNCDSPNDQNEVTSIEFGEVCRE